MCGSVRRILRSRLFLQLYNTRRHWRVSVSGLESSSREEEREKKRGAGGEGRGGGTYSCPRGTRGRPFLESASSIARAFRIRCSSWAGDARARAKQADSSFESLITVSIIWWYKYITLMTILWKKKKIQIVEIKAWYVVTR